MGGPGSGRHRLPAEVKRRRGTFREDRDGSSKRPRWLAEPVEVEESEVAPTEQPLPQGLGKVGLAAWTAQVAYRDLQPLEVPLLAVLCRHLDVHDELMAVVRRDGALQNGQVHPALMEAREQAAILVTLGAVLRSD